MTFENDEFYDEFYATICPSCNENSIDEHDEKCGSCMLDELAETYNEDIALEMSLGLDY
jgi:hypothetical protein